MRVVADEALLHVCEHVDRSRDEHERRAQPHPADMDAEQDRSRHEQRPRRHDSGPAIGELERHRIGVRGDDLLRAVEPLRELVQRIARREPERDDREQERAERGRLGTPASRRDAPGGERDEHDADDTAIELHEELHAGERSTRGREPPPGGRFVPLERPDAAEEGEIDGHVAQEQRRPEGDEGDDDANEDPVGARGSPEHDQRERDLGGRGIGEGERGGRGADEQRSGEEPERAVREEDVTAEVETVRCGEVEADPPGVIEVAAGASVGRCQVPNARRTAPPSQAPARAARDCLSRSSVADEEGRPPRPARSGSRSCRSRPGSSGVETHTDRDYRRRQDVGMARGRPRCRRARCGRRRPARARRAASCRSRRRAAPAARPFDRRAAAAARRCRRGSTGSDATRCPADSDLALDHDGGARGSRGRGPRRASPSRSGSATNGKRKAVSVGFGLSCATVVPAK